MQAVLMGQFDGGHMDWDDGWGVVMVIGMILFWVLVLVAVIWLVRELGGSRRPAGAVREEPLQVLDRHLAEGTISVEEYQQRRAALLDAADRS